MITYFISDLHLQESCRDTANLFFNFLATQARQADAVYILGDFFELWVGDDADSIFLQKVSAALQSLATANVPVYFMHGNRDFLIGKDFIKKTNCIMLSDPCVVDLYGTKWLLCHGDTLIDDPNYKRFRYIVRHPLIQAIFRKLPLKFRLGIAKKMRDNSQKHYQHLVDSNTKILDVSQALVDNMLTQHKVYGLIHGHTHRPGIHRFDLNHAAATRVVLGCWEKQAQILAYTPDGYQLETI